MALQPPFYPIVYLRGYAGGQSAVEETVSTPYMGFNLGATKLRQTYEGKPEKYVFESPLVRLIKDHDYDDCYRNGDYPQSGESIPARSIWISRYYEVVSEELGEGEPQTMRAFAEDLRALILRIRDHVCGTDTQQQDAFKVHLVAHSMGGLIARCYLQTLCTLGARDEEGQPDDQKNQALALSKTGGVPLVAKVFTYGTPHNGIELLGVNVPNLGPLDTFQSKVFNRKVMRDYLSLPAKTPKNKAVNSLNNSFDPNRFFCFIGTNYKDYTVAMGITRRTTGAMSDGLVMCKNAWVQGAPRAYAHRAHSGWYGLVNSEEGYQNLRRFLFGDVRVDVFLDVDKVTFPKPIQGHIDKGKTIRAVYYIETVARIRGERIKLHERIKDQGSAIMRKDTAFSGPKANAIFLMSGFLNSKNRSPKVADQAMNFAVDVRVLVPEYEIDYKYWFDDYVEGATLYNEQFNFFVRFTADGSVNLKYGTQSKNGAGVGKRNPTVKADGDVKTFSIPIGFSPTAAQEPHGKLRGTLLIKAQRI
ncbi:esterase/lipase family protein [Acanthopleuribacter pedis]|uniref:PGAP1-like protein n=1 Tax=Acanthopleuribacter pedis TaxID=442870 RepID=A0A8J7U840_9BACT|nr:hypothetical protein [Acanthopleuribacter pedis]MBO1323173.1 hypothetical protein [Acanthopleuribacter pedis]